LCAGRPERFGKSPARERANWVKLQKFCKMFWAMLILFAFR
jgi:hypothetical protein